METDKSSADNMIYLPSTETVIQKIAEIEPVVRPEKWVNIIRSVDTYIAPMNSSKTNYDAVIIGGGHNGLVCAFYLAKAGLKTVICEPSINCWWRRSH